MACQNSTADADAELERFQILAIGSALLSLNSAQAIATDGVGVAGFLPNESATARYEFTPGADGGYLLAVYTNADAVRQLDAILALEVSGGRALFRVDRNGGGPAGSVERRESILSGQTYRATVSAMPGTFGSFAIAVAGSPVSGGGSCVVSASECRDYNVGADETRVRADCMDAGGTFQPGSCTTTARVGQCTSAGANTGIFTHSGYSPGFLNATLYQAHCLATYGVDQFVVN